jgi:hypothetical protein
VRKKSEVPMMRLGNNLQLLIELLVLSLRNGLLSQNRSRTRAETQQQTTQ